MGSLPIDSIILFKSLLGVNSAILRYDGALNVDPTSTGNPTNKLNEWDLHVSPLLVSSTLKTDEGMSEAAGGPGCCEHIYTPSDFISILTTY